MVMVTQECTYVQIHQIVYMNYMQCFVDWLYTSIKLKERRNRGSNACLRMPSGKFHFILRYIGEN